MKNRYFGKFPSLYGNVCIKSKNKQMVLVEKLGKFYQSKQSIELQNCCVANVTLLSPQ